MSLQTLDMPMSVSPPPVPKPAFDPMLLEIIQNAAKDAADLAGKSAFEAAGNLTRKLLADVDKKLSSIEAPRPQVLAITFDNGATLQHLSAPAVPFLGRLILNAKLGLNTLLVGPAGCGKTFAAHQLAEALQKSFGHVCFTAGASETWLFGRQTPTGFIEGTFSRLYRSGGVFLADEMDAADANMLLALNTALANGTLFNPINGETYTRHADFVFIGGANTVGKGGDQVYTGRNRLDAATLNRFVLIAVDYNSEVERVLCPDKTMYKVLKSARDKLRNLKSDEIISTRTFEIAYKQLQAGISGDDILGSLTLGWPAEIIDQCKLAAYPVQSAEPAYKPQSPAMEAAIAATEAAVSKPDTYNDDPIDSKIRANEARIAALKAELKRKAGLL